jgi:hypothetical protein
MAGGRRNEARREAVAQDVVGLQVEADRINHEQLQQDEADLRVSKREPACQLPHVEVPGAERGNVEMSRKKKPKQATYPDQDVHHNRPSLEREIEMLREENIRLIVKVNRLQAQLDGVRLRGS